MRKYFILLLLSILLITIIGCNFNSPDKDAPSAVTPTPSSSSDTGCCDNRVRNAEKYLGYPYVSGGKDEINGGFDCSGLIYYATLLSPECSYVGNCAQCTTIAEGSIYEILKNQNKIKKVSDGLNNGDIVFFYSGHTHVAFYSTPISIQWQYPSNGIGKIMYEYYGTYYNIYSVECTTDFCNYIFNQTGQRPLTYYCINPKAFLHSTPNNYDSIPSGFSVNGVMYVLYEYMDQNITECENTFTNGCIGNCK